MTPSTCLSVEALKQFRGGLLPETEARHLAQHLRGCPVCVGHLATALADDPLVLGLRAQHGRPRLRNPLLERARQDCRAQPLRLAAGEEATPAIGAAEATLAPAPGSPVAPATQQRLLSFPVSIPEGPCCFLSPPQAPGELGRLGSYRVLCVLGEGGMGMVLLAEDTRLQRRVALKVMKPLLAADPASRQRFLREARATAALEHDHVIVIHHIDEANGVPYLAMPLLQGETLEDRLRRESVLAVTEVLRIGRETAAGLAAAHTAGLIHRDVKPGNLWLEAPSGRVKVLDFGLASMPVPEGEKTLPGTLLGTPGYMAPEQTEGQADARSDLFSLGCVLYRMATGQLPFRGESAMQKIRNTLFEAPQPPQEINPALPGALCHLILRLLARKPEERPATALAVARVLETIEGQIPRNGLPPLALLVPGNRHLPDATERVAVALPPAAVKPPSSRRRRLLLGGGIVAATLLLTVLLVRPFRSPSGSEGKERRGEDGGPSADRPNAAYPKWPVGEELPPPREATRDRRFRESWVTNPEPIEGLTSWCIEPTVGKSYPTAFHFTNDEQLLIQYNGGPWEQFDSRTCGLRPAPFGGTFHALTKDGRVCARLGQVGVELWEEGDPIQKRVNLPSPGPWYEAAFAPDGMTIATFDRADGRAAYRLGFWDVNEGSSLGELSGEAELKPPLNAQVYAWSPDSKTLAVSLYGQDGIALFRSPWKGPVKVIRSEPGVTALAWSPDAQLLATVGKDGQAYLIDVTLGAVVDKIPGGRVAAVPAWEPRVGTSLAVATLDKKSSSGIARRRRRPTTSPDTTSLSRRLPFWEMAERWSRAARAASASGT